MDNEGNKKLEKYLSQVDSYLRYMSVSEKTDILSKLKSGFYESLKKGQTEEAIIAGFGDPKELAMGYMGEAIVKKQGFSVKRFMMVLGFYSCASVTWVAIIPSLALLSISFFFSSAISILAGLMGLLKGIVHISVIDNLKFVFLIYELKGIPALLVGLLMAIIFIGLGVLCWKAAIWSIRFLKLQKWNLNHKFE